MNELVSKIAVKLCFNDQPSKVADCKDLDELSPVFRQRAQDCSDASKLIADAISQHRNASPAPVPAAAAVVPAASQPTPAGASAASAASLPATFEGVLVKTNSNSFPSLSKSIKFISIKTEGLKWFEVSPSVGQGDARGSMTWTQVQGAATAGTWGELFGVEIKHPGVKKDFTFLWCKFEQECNEINSAIIKNLLLRK